MGTQPRSKRDHRWSRACQMRIMEMGGLARNSMRLCHRLLEGSVYTHSPSGGISLTGRGLYLSGVVVKNDQAIRIRRSISATSGKSKGASAKQHDRSGRGGKPGLPG